MKRDDVYALCKQIAPQHNVDPILALALCEQESVDDHDPTNYHADALRLEEGFYCRFVKPLNFSTVTEGMLSASYGLTQMMGESLREVGFIGWHFNNQTTDNDHPFLVQPMQNLHVVLALDEYCSHPEWQIEWGLKFFDQVKHQDLLKWNGGGDPQYPAKVLARRDKLITIYGGKP